MTPILEVTSLEKRYPVKSGWWRDITGNGATVQAVSGVSFLAKPGEVLGLVGESGCGKTTLARMLVRLERPTAGSIHIDGTNVANLPRQALSTFRRRVQMIFQDPFDSLNPRHTAADIVAQPLRYLKLARGPAARKAAHAALERVELDPATFAARYPHQLSGGQRQRVAIARALVVAPHFIVADEPVSMLDVSVRASVLTLLQKLNQDTGIAILLVTHDLAVAAFLCHRVMVMYLGKLVEILPADDMVHTARHPYTRLLLDAVPDLARDGPPPEIPASDPPNALSPPPGCRFSPRCPLAQPICRQQEPKLLQIAAHHSAACHLIPNEDAP